MANTPNNTSVLHSLVHLNISGWYGTFLWFQYGYDVLYQVTPHFNNHMGEKKSLFPGSCRAIKEKPSELNDFTNWKWCSTVRVEKIMHSEVRFCEQFLSKFGQPMKKGWEMENHRQSISIFNRHPHQDTSTSNQWLLINNKSLAVSSALWFCNCNMTRSEVDLKTHGQILTHSLPSGNQIRLANSSV